MIKLVLLRHGESVWNKENLFTGWTDVNLSDKGVEEAHTAGKLMREAGFVFGAQTRHPHPVDLSGRNGPDVDSGD